jgi:hypothetical protein
MRMPPWRPRSTREAQAGLQFALGTVTRPNPIVILWRWRYEACLAVGIPVFVLAAVSAVGAAWTIAAMAIFAAWSTMWPRSRRYLAACSWWVITPHRVRTGCAQGWVYSKSGKLPVVLRTTQHPFGQRVLVWCRAGTNVQDFIQARELLTAACWAHDIYIYYDPRHTHLVTLDVIRIPDKTAEPKPSDSPPNC